MPCRYKSKRLRTAAVLSAFVFALLPACSAPQTAAPAPTPDTPQKTVAPTYKYTNKLIGATSPYLLEHAHNPVQWQPWGSEALEQAKREHKPIFLSIGYSACHWCHVMAREDFENEEIANLLNANFVCIKVDREQRPDVDSQYMLAVQMMTGSGGWPLSVFLTPDRKPFFGGTYFPPIEFKSLLGKILQANKTQPEQVRALADRIARSLADSSASPATSGDASLSAGLPEKAVVALNRVYDATNGGFGGRPKFPDAPKLAFLLARFRATHQANLLNMVTRTLDSMAEGGLYDQLGGGFHRYSTDAIWRVPHFEKMLYDQAQLVHVYLDAYELTHTPRYKQVVEETLAFVQREMRDPAGGFWSTLDADSEGEEGKFYLWTPEQVKAVLDSDADLFCAAYGVTTAGDLDGKSVLHRTTVPAEIAQQYHIPPVQMEARLNGLREKLLTARATRVRPHTDDKVLASWNGLMVGAFARAAQVLHNPIYRQTATEAATFLMQKMTDGSKLRHSYRAGKAEVNGMLEDYAFVANGMLDLYAATQEKKWLQSAQTLATQMRAQFEDATIGGFYSTSDQSDLLTRLKTADDNATPSGNGMAAQVCARLAALTGNAQWRTTANRTVQAFATLESRVPAAFPLLLTTYQSLTTPANAPQPHASGKSK